MHAISRPPRFTIYARLDTDSEKLRRRLEKRLRCTTNDLVKLALRTLDGRDADKPEIQPVG
jgi:hypothetical protein